MGDYVALKHLHVATVGVSYLLFFVRGAWMLADSPMLTRRWVRVVPHVNDTILLAAAIWLTTLIQQYPGTHGWLTAKVVGLVAYILIGTVAIRRGRTKHARLAAWLVAQAVFVYIVAVALTRDVIPPRAWL
ncbi:MAG: SirB2 family protein [Burkholderiales bacterium]|nr:SirB2 family protein [Burkholderiales bacterium]